MTLILVVVSISLVASFLCSLCEAALYAITPARVEAVRRGSSSGRKLGQLRDRVDEAIAGILTVNTITHTVGAAWAGALVGERYGATWLGIFSAVFTLAILFFTEIVPKSLGVAWASVLAVRLAWLIQLMIWLVWPLAKICTFLMKRLTRRAPGQEPSEEELMIMADLAARGGTILAQESRWVKNVLRLNDVTARRLMTPRSAIQSLPADTPLAQVEMQALQWVHSRIPLTESGSLDRVVGVVPRRIVFDQVLQGERTKRLRDLMRPALFVAESIPGHQLLELLIAQRQQLAMVTDRNGSITGLVSLEDVLEYLLGRQIVGEHDTHPEMRRMEQERLRLHATTLERDPGAEIPTPESEPPTQP